MSLIKVQNVSKIFQKGEYATSLRDTLGSLFSKKSQDTPSPQKSFLALNDISFELNPGDVLALIGSNGSGKSTLLKLIAGILRPNQGAIHTKGRISALIEMVAGTHPDLTGLENIFLSGAILGMSRKEINARLDNIIEFSGLAEFIHTPLKRYSSGMHMRLGFSVAIHVDPDILLLDEILAVGDADFQKKCFERVSQLTKGTKGIILVTHNMAIVSAICNRAILLDKGQFIAQGTPSEMIQRYELLLANKAKELQAKQVQPKLFEHEKISMTYCQFFNAEKKETRQFNLGETIELKIHGVSHENLHNVGFVVCADRYDGLRCFLSNSSHTLNIDVPQGEFTMAVELHNLQLLPGTYDFKFAVVDENYLFDYATRFGEFITVTSPIVFDDRYGIFQPSVSWSLTKA